MCRAAYSPTQEKRELGMTKVTGITASYARCKLSENSEGLRRPLISEEKKVEVIAYTVADECDWIFRALLSRGIT
jgi:hypothetical protein